MARKTKLIFFFLLSSGACFFFSRASDENVFSVKAVSSSLPPHPEWAIPPPSPQEETFLKSILSQKFTFLGNGAQAIAFQSEDGKHVLKVFKMHRLTPSFADQLCPHMMRRRLRNLRWVFNGHKHAYEMFRKESGLVWIHLAKTQTFHHTITLLDEQGKQHLLDVDQAEFVLQEKAELLFDHLKRLYNEGKHEQAEEAIASMLQFIQQRASQGFADRDKGISGNYGFVEGRPIQVDLGRFHKIGFRRPHKQGRTERQVERFKLRIEKWKEETKIEPVDG